MKNQGYKKNNEAENMSPAKSKGDSAKKRLESTVNVLLSPETRALRGLYATDGKSCDNYGDALAFTDALLKQTDAIREGNLDSAERMLYSQAVTLEGIFTRLLEQSLRQDYMTNMETMMKLALRAQNQSRATLETLRSMKAEPAIFSRQTNIAHGPQQVNNAGGSDMSQNPSDRKNSPNELLEKTDEQRLDTGTTGSAGRIDPNMGAMAEIHRAEDS